MSVTRTLVVSVHDVAPPHWDRVQRLLRRLAAIGVRQRSLLLIPNYRGRWRIDADREFCAWLRHRQQEGDEMVLHGYEHVGVGAPTTMRDRFKNRWFTYGEGEFLSLDYDEARTRIERGLEIAHQAKIVTEGFVAPAWLINGEGLRAVRDCGFQYTNLYLRFVDLANGWSRFAPSLVFGPGHLNEDLGIAVQRRVTGLLARRPIVRVVLHPPCVDHPARLERILALIETRVGHHQPVTYGQLLAGLRADMKGAGSHREQ